MISITLYTRTSCHLCEETADWLRELAQQYPIEVQEFDIEKDPAKHKQFMEQIPVVVIGSYTLRAPIQKERLEVAIRSALHGKDQQARANAASSPAVGLNRINVWFSDHWLALMTSFFALYLGGAFMPPFLMHWGYTNLANLIYTIYSFFCHQLAFRSFFLFGEQAVYPREAAHVSELSTFGQITGLSELDLLGARAFVGNPIMGYKVALCERDVAIYAGLILFAVLFVVFKKYIKPLPVPAWLLFSLLPIALDGGSQLVSQIPLAAISDWLPLRESTPFVRTFTGFLFGWGTAWLGFPIIDESMRE